MQFKHIRNMISTMALYFKRVQIKHCGNFGLLD